MKFKVKNKEELLSVLPGNHSIEEMYDDHRDFFNIVKNYEGRTGPDPCLTASMLRHAGFILEFHNTKIPEHIGWLFVAEGYVWSLPMLVTNGKGEPVRFLTPIVNNYNRNGANT